MGVGAQDDLGGHQTFARKMTCFSEIGFETVFSVQVKVIPKQKKRSSLKLRRFFLAKFGWYPTKKVSLKLRRFFCPNLGDLQKKGLHWIAENFRGTKLPKYYKIAQNFHALLTP